MDEWRDQMHGRKTRGVKGRAGEGQEGRTRVASGRPFSLSSSAWRLTSFSWVLSLVVWKFWLSSSTSFSKSERTSLNPELTGPICLFMLGFTRVTMIVKRKEKKKTKKGRMYLEMLVKRFLTHPHGRPRCFPLRLLGLGSRRPVRLSTLLGPPSF